jgi:H+/Cl- antiporter ClcA
MHRFMKRLEPFAAELKKQPWWKHALIASSVLSLLYLFGGPLTEFTGNEAIVPLHERAELLGAWSILWIVIVKICAIGWSKSLGYRGGMIFPTVFVAAGIASLLQLNAPGLNFIYALLAVMAGAFIANRKLCILF